MASFPVVEVKIIGQTETYFRYRSVIVKIDPFLFDRQPKAFHKDVVIDPAPAIHADPDSCPFQDR